MSTSWLAMIGAGLQSPEGQRLVVLVIVLVALWHALSQLLPVAARRWVIAKAALLFPARLRGSVLRSVDTAKAGGCGGCTACGPADKACTQPTVRLGAKPEPLHEEPLA
jgi:hypothetical protein